MNLCSRATAARLGRWIGGARHRTRMRTDSESLPSLSRRRVPEADRRARRRVRKHVGDGVGPATRCELELGWVAVVHRDRQSKRRPVGGKRDEASTLDSATVSVVPRPPTVRVTVPPAAPGKEGVRWPRLAIGASLATRAR